MNNVFETSKNELLKQLEASIPLIQQSGIGGTMHVEGIRQIDVDLSVFNFLPEGATVYTNEEQYFIVSSTSEVLYLGSIDQADGDETVVKDLIEFPHLTEVTILLGKGDIKGLEKLLDDPVYFMNYCSEMMGGMMKAHKNGHIDIEAELNKVLS